MANSIAQVKVSRDMAPKRGAVKRLSIEIAKGGVTVEVNHASANGEMEYHPALTEKQVFTKPGPLVAYIKACCFGKGEDDTAAHEGAESKAEEKAEHAKGGSEAKKK